MRVLVGVDGSAGSLAAAAFIGKLLAAGKDELLFYYSPPAVWVRAVPDASGTAEALQSFLVQAVFEKARQQLPATLQASVQTIVGTRDARQGLLIAADDRRADLIVVGARGTGPMRQPAMGSLARYVAHHATVPVLIVRGAPPAGGLRVLLASDGSDLSRHAGEILARFAWPPGSIGETITVLEATPEGRIPEWLVEQLTDQQLAALGLGCFPRDTAAEAQLREQVASWYGTLPAMFQGREPLVVAGHAPDQILRAVERQRSDLVVLGARRQGAIRRLLLGSTSEHVLTHAPCSVLVVRGHEVP